MDNFETIYKQIEKFRYGWLDPQGHFVACVMYGHFDELCKRGLYLDDLERLKELEEQYFQDQHDFTAHLDPDEHPGWHAFSSDAEDALSALRTEILTKLYNDGWVRLGTRLPLSNGRHRRSALLTGLADGLLEIEGTAKGMARVRKLAKDLAEIMGYEFAERLVHG